MLNNTRTYTLFLRSYTCNPCTQLCDRLSRWGWVLLSSQS